MRSDVGDTGAKFIIKQALEVYFCTAGTSRKNNHSLTTNFNLVNSALKMVHHHSSSNHTCPVPDASGPAILPLAGSLTAHSVFIIIAGATALFAGLAALLLIFLHATHFSCPREQKQIIRIISILPFFAIISFLCVWLDGSPNPYISPGRDVAESLPMASFFLLMTAYITPDEGGRDEFFAQMALLDKKGNAAGGGSLLWYHISIIRIISTFLAIVAILQFYRRSSSVLKPRGALKQLICFKVIVFLNFIQTFVFNFLRSGGHIKASKHFTLNDLTQGLPSLILCCEMAVLAPFFFLAYSFKPYRLGSSLVKDAQRYEGGPLGLYAIIKALNIFDIVIEMVQGVKAKFRPGNDFGASPQSNPDQAQGYYSGPERPQYANPSYGLQDSVAAAKVGHGRGNGRQNGY
ncbi:hypothetical protein NA57DRAFT_61850 [Rhizodiscina lignyota]|uniref:DUF300-domain-containing protein n=1 Tax=Rhizodiscina lignyota TaxID=1504668 RepID=A0A9P4I107_9PEZI|nr:hypothetical protein NA57DRAFT_61850 [Rhizodiscina lignyota]